MKYQGREKQFRPILEVAPNLYVRKGDILVDKLNNKLYVAKEDFYITPADYESFNFDLYVANMKLEPITVEIYKLTPPQITSTADYIKVGETVTLTACCSKSTEGETITYHWILPDGSTQEGEVVNYTVPTTWDKDSLTFICYATDEYNNRSPYARKVIEVVDNYPPVISKFEIEPAPMYVAGNTYKLYVSAIDPEGTDITVEITPDPNYVEVKEITPNSEYEVYFPKTGSDYNTTLTLTVSDADGATATKQITVKVVNIVEKYWFYPQNDARLVGFWSVDPMTVLYLVADDLNGEIWVGLGNIAGGVLEGNKISHPDYALKLQHGWYFAEAGVLKCIGQAFNKSDGTQYGIFLLEFDLNNKNITKAVIADFKGVASAISPDDGGYSLSVYSTPTDNKWGYFVIFDDQFNLKFARKCEYNHAEYYSDDLRYYMDFYNWVDLLPNVGGGINIRSKALFLVNATGKNQIVGGLFNLQDGTIGNGQTITINASISDVRGIYIPDNADLTGWWFGTNGFVGCIKTPDFKGQLWTIYKKQNDNNYLELDDNTKFYPATVDLVANKLIVGITDSNGNTGFRVYNLDDNPDTSAENQYTEVLQTITPFQPQHLPIRNEDLSIALLGGVDTDGPTAGVLEINASYNPQPRNCIKVDISTWFGSTDYNPNWASGGSTQNSDFKVYYYDIEVNTQDATTEFQVSDYIPTFGGCEIQV